MPKPPAVPSPPPPSVAPERPGRRASAQERDADRRQRLLEAGMDIFATSGFAGSAITTICSRAHVTARNFYDHFASREELLMAIYDEIVIDVASAMVHAMAEARDEPRAQIRAGLTAFVETMAVDERRLWINFVEVVGASPAVERRRRAAIGDFCALLVYAVEHQMQRGAVPPRDVSLTASVLVGAIQESLIAWVNRDERQPLQDVIDELVRVYELALLTP